MPVNPHHAVPKPLTQAPPPQLTDVVVTGTTTTGTVAGGPVQLGGAKDVLLIMLLSIVGFLASLALMLLASALRGRVRVVRAGTGEGGQGIPRRLGSYMYKGGRAALRRVYLALVSRLSSHGVALPRGATASEAAKAAVGAGLLGEESSAEFSRLYNFFMYSRVEPGPDDVERIADLAGVRDAVERRR